MSSRRWAIRAAQVAAAVVALALIIAVVVHLAPVRRAALRRVITLLAERFDVVLRADTLDYNLLGLRATLTGVEIAAARTPDQPFLTADRLEVEVPRSVLFGAFSLDRIALGNARIDIRRDAAGRLNLPESQATADPGEPQAVPIGRLQITQLAFAYADEVQGLSVDLPALTVDLGSDEGMLRLTRAGQVRAGDVATTISALGGGVAFDGRTLGLTGFELATPELSLQTSGALALLVREPSLDLRFAGQTDLTGLRRLVPAVPALVGRVGAEGTVVGPLSTPRATAKLTSDQLAWDQLTLTNLEAAIDADAMLVRLQQVAASVAGGRLTGAGEIGPADQRADLTFGWTDVDLDALTRALGVGGPRPAAAATGNGTVRGAGSNIQDWTIEARTTLTPRRRARGQISIGSDVDLRVADGRWALNANGVVERVPVQARVGGVLSTESIPRSTLAGTVATTIGDLPVVLGSLRDAGLLDVPPDTITAGRLDAQATLSGTIEAPRLQATVAGRELAAAGLSNLSLDATAAGTLRQLDVDARLQQDADNEIRAVGTVYPETARINAQVSGTLRNTRGLVPDVPFDGSLALDVAVDGPFDALTAKGTITATDAAYAGFMLGRVTAALDATADAARVQLDASELATRVDAEIGLTGDRKATIDLAVDGVELERLLQGVESPVKVTGRVGLNAKATGALADWRRGTAEVDLTRLDATVGELPVRLASPGRLTYRDETIDVASLEAQVGDTRLSLAGRLPASETAPAVPAADALRALLVGDLTQVIEAVRATGVTEVPEFTARGPVALLARVTGTAERPIVAADLDVANATLELPGLPAIRGEEIRATVANGWIERLVASGEWQQSRFRIDARAPLQLFREYLPAAVLDALPAATGPATLDAQLTSVTRSVLEPFVDPEGLQQIDGQVDASARLETTSLNLADLRGEARLDRLDIRLAGLPVTQSEPTRLVFEGGLARVAAWQWTGEGATLDVQGQLGLTDQQAAILAAGRFDLRLLTPFLRGGGVGIAGTVSPRVSISGSLTDPRIDGQALVTDAEIRLRDPRVVATDLDATISLTPQEARIESLTGFVNGGTLTGTGRAQYGPGVSPSGQISGTITGFGIELPEGLRSELNADLTVAIKQDEELTTGAVTGTVTVVRSTYREPLAVIGGLLTALQTERLVAARADPTSLPAQMTLDVRVITDSDIVVDNNLARLQLAGDLRVIGTAAAPALSGRAVIREGGRLFLGQNVYTLDQNGTIDFADPVAIVPDLNLTATTRAGGEDIVLTISGTPDDLSVDLDSTSSPELGQADIASLLLTGRRLDDVSGAEADIVREQVLGYLSGDVLALAGRRVGLDSIRLGGPDTSFLRRDPAAVAAEADPTSRLTFSKDIRHDIELTYSQSLRDGDAQTWIVDYEPITRVNVRFVSDDDDMRAYEFRHDLELGGGSAQRRAQSSQTAPVLDVTTVTITGETGIPEVELRRVLNLEAGDRFDFADWQRDHDRLEEALHARGFLEARITARRAEGADGVALTYAISAGRPARIVVTGYSPSSGTRRQLEEAWTQSVFDDFLKEEADGIVRTELAEQGYLEPQITLDLLTTDTRTLQIAVQPGTRVSSRRLVIAADGSSIEGELESWARAQRLDSRWRVPEDVREPMAAELRARGYLNAEVTAAAPRIEDGAAVLTMNVEPGPRFLVGDVGFTGATQIDGDRLRQIVALDADTPYDPAAVDDARRRLDALYRSEGFASTRVRVEPAVDRTQARVGVVFVIQEGPQQLLQNVTVVGNRSIDTDVITRAMDVPVGEPLSANAWLQSRTRLFDTNLFRRVDVTTEPIEEGSAIGIQPTRLRVAVEEWPALRIRYGVQVAEQRPEDSTDGRDLAPGLSADVTRRTLFGRAVSVGGAVEIQRRERLVRVFMNSPTTFGLPVQSLLTAERSHRDFAADTFVTDSDSIAWEQRVRLHPSLQLSYAYRFERDHTFDTAVSDDPFLPPFDITVNIARLTGSAAFDTRDDPYDSTRGWLMSSSLELSPTSLGSDVSFVRLINQGYYFRPWRKLVFASAARLGIVNPLGGQTLIPSELFFSGGSRSVRGVEEDTLGPQGFFGFPEGGRALVVLNQEARFPIYRWVRGVGFIDAGNVFETPRSIDLGKLVVSYGGGLRIATPFALLRIDYGRVRENSTAVRGSEWTFGIGHTF